MQEVQKATQDKKSNVERVLFDATPTFSSEDMQERIKEGLVFLSSLFQAALLWVSPVGDIHLVATTRIVCSIETSGCEFKQGFGTPALCCLGTRVSR
jgi:hypothetical protein